MGQRIPRAFKVRRDWVAHFDAHAGQRDGCWEWQGTRLRADLDYGTMRIDGQPWRAHRVSFFLHYGDLPAGSLICHHCDNPPCVNPEHLYAGTYSDNAWDREGRHRRTIPRGEASATAVLTEPDVHEIRRLCATRVMRQVDIAEMFDISRAMVSMIHTRKNWTHV